MAIYKCICKIENGGGVESETRLIEAKNTAQAMAHASGKWLTVERLTTAEAVDLGAKGLRVESAA